jgi:hypothetical protein
MTPDWNLVTLEHVRRACEMYDAGTATPKRPAKSAFLILNEKPYPAKFIRGLAYRLATGVELDPNVDYAGGEETVKFFQALGLSIKHGPAVVPAMPAPPVPEPTSPPAEKTPDRHRRQEPQKEALSELLARRFGAVEREATFPWLTVPSPDQMDGTISALPESPCP